MLATLSTTTGDLNYGFKEDITVGGSPFTLQNTYAFQTRVYIHGGTLTLLKFKQDAWDDTDAITLGLATTHFDLASGDVLTCTYLVAPTMEWHPV